MAPPTNATTRAAPRIRCAVSAQDFDVGAEMAAMAAGAVASFVGHVRADDGVAILRLEHHPVMTIAALETLAADAAARWALCGVALLHRIGPLRAGERIVLVIAASAHRAAALDACAYLIDRLKTDVPLWKCETLADGTARWVEPRAGDDARAALWG
ncbi:MAG: molybdenum cofactor biosynthesis protein MoaE [Sphingopyxis sp.]